jgi:hypothetical protein
MSKPVTKSSILDDGLRYKAKSSGSPFGVAGAYGGNATMSCFLCGKHRPRTDLMSKRLLGKSHVVCSPKCGA